MDVRNDPQQDTPTQARKYHRPIAILFTGDFFEEWDEITPEIHKLTQRTLWMSEMTSSKAPILKLFVLQIF